MKILNVINDAEIVRKFFEKTRIRLSYLISYYYAKGQISKLLGNYREYMEDLFLDSGTFSVMQRKSQITLAEYCQYLKLFGDQFEGVFSFDDDFNDPEHNLYNHLYLLNELPDTLRPIPVVHDAQNPLEEIGIYAGLGHDYIALGSNRRLLTNDLMANIRQQFPQIRFHALGKQDRNLLERLNPYSVDTTTFVRQAGYGIIYFWHPELNQEFPVYIGGKKLTRIKVTPYREFEYRGRLDRFLSDTFGYTHYDLLADEDAKRNVNLYFFKQLEDYFNAQTPPEQTADGNIPATQGNN